MDVVIDVTPTLTVTDSHRALTGADRCDRCGAQAYVRAVLVGGGDLLFCRHHGQVHHDKLSAIAVEIDDQTGLLDGAPYPAGAAPQ